MLKWILSYTIFIFLLTLYWTFHIHKSFFIQTPKGFFIPIVTIFVLMILLSTIGMRFVPLSLFRVLSIFIYIFMIFLLYNNTFYFLGDILSLFLKISPLKMGIFVLSISTLLVVGGYINTRFIREKTYTLESSKVTKDIKIALVSDFHVGSPDITHRKMEKMVEKINRQNPDIVLIAGDMVDTAAFDMQKMGYIDILKKLTPATGTFASLGNHEYYFGSTKPIIDEVTQIPTAQILNNEIITLPKLRLQILGLSDKGLNPQRVKKPSDFSWDNSMFHIIIEHDPINFRENIKEVPIDLQVSGHTHAGQFIIGNLVVRLIYDKPWGLFKLKDSTLITTSGVGSWGPPIRDVTYPEIVFIKVKKTIKSA